VTNNNSTARDYHGNLENNDAITYEFKPELTIYDSSSNPNISSSRNDSDYNPNSLDNFINTKLEECENKYNYLLYNTIMDEYIEEGYMSNSQKLYERINAEFGYNITYLFLNKLYIKNSLNNKLIKSVLYIMSELNPDNLNGNEVGIIVCALANKDYETRDLALRCFETWNDTKYLDLLKSFDIGVEFLVEYLQYIIKTLEEKLEKERVV
jgi:hypothetical protein